MFRWGRSSRRSSRRSFRRLTYRPFWRGCSRYFRSRFRMCRVCRFWGWWWRSRRLFLLHCRTRGRWGLLLLLLSRAHLWWWGSTLIARFRESEFLRWVHSITFMSQIGRYFWEIWLTMERPSIFSFEIVFFAAVVAVARRWGWGCPASAGLWRWLPRGWCVGGFWLGSGVCGSTGCWGWGCASAGFWGKAGNTTGKKTAATARCSTDTAATAATTTATTRTFNDNINI